MYDVTEGGNGKCDDDYSSGCSGSMHPLSLTDCGQGVLICNAAAGYDGPSGVGAPNGIEAFKPGILPPAKPNAPETRSATSITSEAATLEGTLRAESVRTSWYFEYAAGASCTGTGAKTTPELQDTMLGEPDEVSAPVTALQPDTEYTICLVAKNSSGSTTGPEVTFKTLPPKPAVLSESASGETRTGVQLSGSVNPENSLTFYQFQYGTSASYGSSTGEAQAGSGLGEVTVGPTTISELKPGTTYHYRLLVSNGSGTTTGEDETFTTLPPTPPIVSTGVATNISREAATLSATVDPRGLSSTYEFDLGASTSYGIQLFGLAGQGTVAETITVSVLFLQPGVTYHYRIQASNTDGTSYGADQTFTTPTYPALTFPPAITPPPKKTTGPKVLTRAQKLAKALKACKRERNTRKRTACIKRARKSYGASKAKSKRVSGR